MNEVDLAAIRARVDAATEGPWFYNSYCAVHSSPKIVTDDEWWTEERLSDGHSYDYRVGQTCEACGPRFTEPDRTGKRYQVWDCALAGDALDSDPLVCHVPPSCGGTATGQRCADAEFIAHARSDVPALLALVEQQQAVIEAVRALHFARGRNLLGQPVCNECSPLQPMPCSTVAALSGSAVKEQTR